MKASKSYFCHVRPVFFFFVFVTPFYGNMVGRCRLDSSGSGQGPVAGSCEHDNEPSDSIKGGGLLDLLSDS
jgi:hypothetical protein